MSEKFKVGDLVKLKSGGPVMIIESEESGKRFECLWFGIEKYHREKFKEELLERVKDRGSE